MDNQSGKTFDNARIKLMAGDVSKIQPRQMYDLEVSSRAVNGMAAPAPAVTERTFDEYHLYTLARPTTLHDRETKQVEFIRAANVPASEFMFMTASRSIPTATTAGIGRVFAMIIHTAPSPSQDLGDARVRQLRSEPPWHAASQGRVRFYRHNDDGQIEFTGENVIDHTPRDENVRVYTGNAFDMTGERRRTDYRWRSTSISGRIV